MEHLCFGDEAPRFGLSEPFSSRAGLLTAHVKNKACCDASRARLLRSRCAVSSDLAFEKKIRSPALKTLLTRLKKSCSFP
jgi:hypothetical protein